ncbi:DUF2799 domain-containing protein [Photobacterium leiognathi]|uniref:DUF2799 domain-containing protein n=1 Tax=Photobacterium leiognathi TaxID=553611 RepID=UPI000769E7DF|nr:DUF2799 domain-containing protein [Photobacterium leiognathi]
MTIKTLTATLILCSTLTACSVMNQQECETANWNALGYVDGSQGAASSQFTERSSACSEYNVRADFAQYQAGYQKGLINYCTESKGFYVGSRGKEYQGVCPAKTASAFLTGYHHGQELYQLKQELNQAEQELRSEKYEVEHQKDKLKDLKNSLIYDNLSSRERREKLDEIEELNNRPNEVHRKLQEVNRLKKQLTKLQDKLNKLY